MGKAQSIQYREKMHAEQLHALKVRHDMNQCKAKHPARGLLGVHPVRQISVIRTIKRKRRAQQTAPIRIMNVTGIAKT